MIREAIVLSDEDLDAMSSMYQEMSTEQKRLVDDFLETLNIRIRWGRWNGRYEFVTINREIATSPTKGGEEE